MVRVILSVLGAITVLAMIAVNMLGGVVSGIWLAALGEWRVIGLGIALSILMPFAWMLTSIPAMVLAGLAMHKADDHPQSRFPLHLLAVASVYNNGLVCAWATWVFWVFEQRIGTDPAAPFLLWAYSTTMSPLAYMASKEQSEDNWAEGLAMTGALVAFIVQVAMYLVGIEGGGRIWAAAIVASGMGGLTVYIAAMMERESHRLVGMERQRWESPIEFGFPQHELGDEDIIDAQYNVRNE